LAQPVSLVPLFAVSYSQPISLLHLSAISLPEPDLTRIVMTKELSDSAVGGAKALVKTVEAFNDLNPTSIVAAFS
jgi:hypothetical protein